jgi:hypothetical protein
MSAAQCTWCGNEVESGSGYRLSEPAAERRAVFCRLEHVVPWAIQGAHWQAGATPPEVAEIPDACSQCGEGLTDAHLLLMRHRAEHRIADAFCSVDHLLEWAKAGGRWRA